MNPIAIVSPVINTPPAIKRADFRHTLIDLNFSPELADAIYNDDALLAAIKRSREWLLKARAVQI